MIRGHMIHAAGKARHDEALCLQQSESLCGSPPILPFPVARTELIAVGLIGMTAASMINHHVPHKREEWGVRPGRGKWEAGREKDLSATREGLGGRFPEGAPPKFSLSPST